MEAPLDLRWDLRQSSDEQAAEFFGRHPNSRLQEAYDFTPAWRDPLLAERLAEREGPLCRYCESPAGPLAGDVEPRHFRPYHGVMTDDRAMLEDYYWWLAYDEANMLLACADCHTRKGKRFPVRGTRGSVGASPTELDALELPALVHPRDFADRLAFGPDGDVSGVDDDARETVSVLQLNRAWLVEARRAAYAEVMEQLRERTVEQFDSTDLAEAYPSTRPYYHLCRQAHRDELERRTGPMDEAVPEPPGWEEMTKPESVVAAAKTEQRMHDAAQSKADVTIESSFATTRTIERIEIRNFKIIDDLELDLRGRPGEWRMLLGENGTGKSTILQAIALTLVDAGYRRRLAVSPQHCLRRGCRRGWIKIQLAGTEEPIRLEFRKDDPDWGGTADEPNAQVLGYGSTRLLPRPGARQDDDSRYARAANLFDPFVALRDASDWLARQHGSQPHLFNAAARLLRQLLDEKAAARLRMNKAGTVELCENGNWKELDQLSDGYQTVVALALDMMSVLTEVWPDTAAAEGVVLIDELGSHLHPRWQMRIVSSLKSAFPRLQFIVSTHNPLCLRGLDQDEVVLMRRRTDNPKRVIAVTQLPPMDGMRVDQLLTSPHFGLGTTLDEDVEHAFQRMYELERLAFPSPLERAELEELERRLAGQERLGDSPAQGQLYRAINDLLRADASRLVQDGPTPLKPPTLATIVAMLDRMDSDRARLGRRSAQPVDVGIPL